MKKIYAMVALLVLLSTTARADIVSLDPAYIESANQVDFYKFTVDTAGAVNLYTSSSAPFNPMLTLWSASPSAWTKVAFNDDTTSWNLFESGSNPKDAQIKVNLGIGTYLASVTNFGNAPLGTLLSAGFGGNGSSQFPYSYHFNVDTDNVAGAAASISGVSVAAVPLPAAAWMLVTGLMGVLAISKRKGSTIV